MCSHCILYVVNTGGISVPCSFLECKMETLGLGLTQLHLHWNLYILVMYCVSRRYYFLLS